RVRRVTMALSVSEHDLGDDVPTECAGSRPPRQSGCRDRGRSDPTRMMRSGHFRRPQVATRVLPTLNPGYWVCWFISSGYFADAGNAGNLSTSRASCWMMTVALRFAAIFLRRSSDATVWARSKLNAGTPSES